MLAAGAGSADIEGEEELAQPAADSSPNATAAVASDEGIRARVRRVRYTDSIDDSSEGAK
jgi:hypothetical protein